LSISTNIAKLKSYYKRITISRWHIVASIALILVIAAAFRLYNVASHRPIYADESLISYVAFAWMKFGAMPYRDIWAPQSYNPIIYVAYQLSYQIFGFNALAIRMVAVVPGVISVVLIYLIGRKLFGHRAGLVGSFIYAIYIPFSVELEHSYGTAYSFVNMLALTALLFLLKGVNHEKKAASDVLIAVSGIMLLLTFTIKPYLSLIFFVAFSIIAHSYGFKIRRLLRPCLVLFAGFLGAFLILVLYLYLNRMLEPWIYTFQVGNLAVSTLPLGEKVIRFWDYLLRTMFVQMFAIPAIIWGFVKRKKEVIYLFFWILIPTITVLMGAFTAGALFTTFPLLVVLSSVSVTWLLNQTASKIKVKDWNAILPAAVLLLALLTANAYTNFAYYANSMYSVNPEVNAQISVGEAIANITRPADKIFTTDTALAVLSQREVITVGSIKVAGFYNDLMGYSYERYIGVPGYPEGIINNDMIRSALELQKPAVIVLSKHDVFGLLDEIIWTGGQEQIYRPLGPYIMKNYVLNQSIEYDEKRWEIWSLSSGNYHELNVFSNQSNIMQVGTQSVSFTFTLQSNNANCISSTTTDWYDSTDQPQNLLINYSFPNQKHAFVRSTIDFHDSVNLTPYKSISLWVKGDNSPNVLWLDLVDNKGREIGILVRNLKFLGWKNVIVGLDSFAEKGANITSIRQMRISIDNHSENIGSGTVTLAHWALLS
jgi:4-amino-4-deoxy-L-arabinose transferase-like glycosyltransferase